VIIYISHASWGGVQPNLRHTATILTEFFNVFFPKPLGANDKTVYHIRPRPASLAHPPIHYSLIIVPFHRTVSAADHVIKYSIIEFKNIHGSCLPRKGWDDNNNDFYMMLLYQLHRLCEKIMNNKFNGLCREVVLSCICFNHVISFTTCFIHLPKQR